MTKTLNRFLLTLVPLHHLLQLEAIHDAIVGGLLDQVLGSKLAQVSAYSDMDLHRPRVAQHLHQRRHQEPKSTIEKSKYHKNYDRNPTNLVGPVPDSDTDASLDGLASRDDGLIILLLLCKRRRVGRSRHANVQLGDSDVDAELGERLDVLLDGSRHCADNEMALNTNTIDRGVFGLEALHEVEHSCRLVAKTFDIVVIDLERAIKLA